MKRALLVPPSNFLDSSQRETTHSPSNRTILTASLWCKRLFSSAICAVAWLVMKVKAIVCYVKQKFGALLESSDFFPGIVPLLVSQINCNRALVKQEHPKN